MSLLTCACTPQTVAALVSPCCTCLFAPLSLPSFICFIMLLDYAAQMKCLTQRRVIHTAISLSHLPADVHHFVLNFSHNAQRLLAHITDEIKAIGTRKHARSKAKKRLNRTQQQLLKATQLIQQGQQVVDRVRPHDSDNEEDEDELEVSSSGLAVDEEEEGGEDITAQVEGAESSESNEPSPAAVANLDSLTEQIRQLKEQMEQLARMQSVSSGASSQEDEEEDEMEEREHDEDRRDESTAVTVSAALDIPIAPPLLSVNAVSSSSSFASIPIASPMLASDIPMAPPLIAAPTIPMAPPLSPATLTASRPVAPPLDMPASSFVAPPAPPMSSVTRSSTRLTAARSALTPLSPNRPSSSSSSSLSGVYTRNIPGASELSHTDLIKVAAAIKLRRTNVPRSPGGTPVKRVDHSALGGSAMGVGGIGEALRRKFQNVNGGGRGSGLVVPASASGSGSGRRSWGEKDKENEWATD